jgi:hypothetical protein
LKAATNTGRYSQGEGAAMKNRRGPILFWSFVLFNAILSIWQEKHFRALAESPEDRVLRLDISSFVGGLVGNTVQVLVVGLVILYVKVRRLEHQVRTLGDELHQARQTPNRPA